MPDRNDYFSSVQDVDHDGDVTREVFNSVNGNYNTFSAGDSLEESGLGFWSRVYNDLTGATAQQREFAQQEYLQDKQNAYNEPAAQMARMKAAGINPNVAASAISQGGNESAQAPVVSNNTAGAAQGLGAAASMLGSLGSSAQGLASAKETNRLLDLRAEQIKADTIKLLEEAGLDHWNSVSIATLLPIMEANQKADFYLKLANYRNTMAEYDNIKARHEEILANIGTLNSEKDLNEQEKLREEEETRWRKEQTDFFVANGYRDDAPLDVSLRNSIVTGKGDPDKIGQAIEDASYKSAHGEFKADEDTAFERFRNRVQGEDTGRRVNAAYFAKLENYKMFFKIIAEMYFSNDGQLSGLAHRFVSILGAELGIGGDVLEEMIKDAYKSVYE